MRPLIRNLPILPLLLFLASALQAQLPDGYVDEPYLDGFVNPVGFVHDATGRMFVWERSGRVFLVENGVKQAPALVDIQEEVGDWRDFGLLGFALDPDFLFNGYVYLYYVVDRHHLIHFGTPSYDPNADWEFEATIGRVTRYTADASTGFHTLVPSSRLVLLGESIDSGIPILHQSHGTGALVFGSDGTLLVSSGDGASYAGTDTGSESDTYWQTALADGIIRDAENVGAFRSQMIGSLSGKILRLDPATGDGVPSNPFHDARVARAPRSRVWALGLRNPFRFTVRPGSGSADPAAGDPGTLLVGDVGWAKWEEVHVVAEPGLNLGWPLYEGMNPVGLYEPALTENRDAPNPLFGGSCSREFFYFQELLKEEREDHTPSFPNPCDSSIEISSATPTFMHRRPALDWRHYENIARVPIFVNGLAEVSELGAVDCPVAGDPFEGTCSVGGVWLSGLGFGEPYTGLYFHADYSASWLKAMRFDDHDGHLHLEEVLEFGSIPAPLFLGEDPADGSLLYTSLSTGSVRRIRYTGDGNVAPQARIESDEPIGASPLTLRLDGTASIDPEGGPLTFAWTFGRLPVSSEPSPLLTFVNPVGGPWSKALELTVTDESGASSTTSVPIHLDNTPPVVEITSFANGATYATDQNTLLVLDALVTDAEHSAQELAYEWQVFLHHGNHQHPEEPIPTPSTLVMLSPTPCSGEFYAYRVVLTVTDLARLETTVEHWLFPDCPGAESVAIVNPTPSAIIDPGDEVLVEMSATGNITRVDLYAGNALVGSSFAPPHEVLWTPVEDGAVVLSALATVSSGDSVASAGLALDVRAPTRATASVERKRDDAEENLLDGAVVRNQPVLDLGLRGALPQLVGLRFQLDVPQGSKVLDAHVELSAARVSARHARLTVRAEAADHAPRLRRQPGDLSSRPTTAAAVQWIPETWRYEGARGPRQRTPDLKQVLQEIVDRPGFQSGNAVVLLIEGFGQRQASAFHLNDGNEARLVVEYVR